MSGDKIMDQSHKYIFVFAGNWNQFREWLRRTGLGDTIFNAEAPHIVYVSKYDDIRGYVWSVYEHAEVRVIGTFWEDNYKLKPTLEELEQRIKAAKYERRNARP
jgi:hypothetical protein